MDGDACLLRDSVSWDPVSLSVDKTRTTTGYAPGKFSWHGTQPRLASLATRWGVGHLRWGKYSQGNQLIHCRLNVVFPASWERA